MELLRPAFRSLHIVVLATICAASHTTYAQYVSENYAHNRETLDWMLDNGIIDVDEYNRWDEYLTDSANVNSRSQDSPDEIPIADDNRQSHPTRFIARYSIYQVATDKAPYRRRASLLFRPNSSFKTDIRLEAGDEGTYEVKSRYLEWSHGDDNLDFNVGLGNVDPVWCGGILVGRFSRFLKNRPLHSSVMFPTDARFNGVCVSATIGNYLAEALVSHDADNLHTASLAGLRILRSASDATVEFGAISATVRNRDTRLQQRLSLFGGKFKRRIPGFGMTTISFSSDESRDVAWTLHCELVESSHDVWIWDYRNGYINPFGAGRANTDTEPIDLRKIDLRYRSRYVGEKGVQTRSRIQLDRLESTIESNWWKTGDAEKIRLRTTHDVKLGGSKSLRATLLVGDDAIGEEDGLLASGRFLFRIRNSRSKNAIVLAHTIRMREYTDRRKISNTIEAELFYGFHSRHPDRIILRLHDPDSRVRADHYLYAALGQNFNPGDNSDVSLLVSTRFGPKQNIRDHTRLNVSMQLGL
jgi:hypothetical protein